jgi:tetratricopeptide (TPR) repeat protein
MAGSEHNLANCLSRAGRLAEAEPNYREALARWEKLVKESPGVVRFRRGLATGYGNLARLLDETDRPHEAEEARRRAAELRQKLPAEQPGPSD